MMSGVTLPREVLFQIFEYSLLEPCDHKECRYVRPCTKNHLPLWYLGRMWRVLLEPLVFRSVCVDWQAGSSKDHESSLRSTLLARIFLSRRILWRHVQRLEIGASRFQDERVYDAAYLVEMLRRGLRAVPDILLRGSWKVWDDNGDEDSCLALTLQRTLELDEWKKSSFVTDPDNDEEFFPNPVSLEFEACSWPMSNLEALLEYARGLKRIKITPAVETPIEEIYTSSALQTALNRRKDSLESIEIRIYGWDGHWQQHDVPGDRRPMETIDFSSFRRLKFLTLSHYNCLADLASTPEAKATLLGAPNLEVLTVDFRPYNRYGCNELRFPTWYVDYFQRFVRQRSTVVQNRKFKKIDMIWDFDKSGGEVRIGEAQARFRMGPWPMFPIRLIDEYTREFGVRVAISGSEEALQRWYDKVQEVLDIYDRGRDAYDFSVPGPHVWIFNYGRNHIHGDRPLPVDLLSSGF